MDASKLRKVRDDLLRFIYENGAGNYAFSVPIEKIEAGLGLSREDISKAWMLIHSQGLTGGGPINSLSINRDGQDEAERLGPRVLMKDPPAPTSVHVGVNYGIMQVAGAGSSQSANQSIDQSQVAAVLDQIEKEIPTLSLEPAAKEEAKGALATLRKAAVEEGSKAGARMIAAGLSDLLRQGGSALWERLPELFRITT